MERDLSLIREILLRIEQIPGPRGTPDLAIDGYTQEEIYHNLDLSIKARLVDGSGRWLQGRKGYVFAVSGLTWEGYDFLDDVRDKSVWQKVLSRAADAGFLGTQLSLDVSKDLAKAIVKEALGLGTGS